MIRLLRNIIFFVWLTLVCFGLFIYLGFYTPAGFLTSRTLGQNTLLVGRVVQISDDYYCLEDLSGTVWIYDDGKPSPQVDSFIIRWCSVRVDAKDKLRPSQVFRVGTF